MSLRCWSPRAWALASLALASCAGAAPPCAVPQQDAKSASVAAQELDAGIGEPIWQEPRFKKALEVVDGLMDGDLSRAEKACSDRPLAEREACVDSIIAQRDRELSAAVADEARAFQLLRAHGASKCQHSAPAKHDECVLRAIEKRLTELEPGCPAPTSALVHRCVVLKIIGASSP